MKILSATVINFGAIGEAVIELDDKGLILVQGVNEDDTSQISNGSGKSTLPDALCWCFYGETAKGESGDAIVNRKAKKDCSVEAVMVDEDDEQVYRITRHRKHKVYKNMLRVEMQQGTSWKDLTKGTDKLTQEIANRVIGCGLEVFASAIYAGQEAMPDLPAMTDKQLKVLIEESAGISQLQTANDIARRIVGERKVVTQAVQTKIDGKKSVIDNLDQQVEQAKEDWKIFETNAKQRIIDQKEVAREAAAAFDSALGDKIIKKVQSLKDEEVTVRAKIASVDAERIEERRLADISGDAGMQHAHAKGQFDSALKKAQEAKHRLDHIGDTVGTDCASCGHVIEADDIAGNEAVAKKAALDSAQKAKLAKADAESKREAAESALKTLADYRASMTDVSAQSETLSVIADKKRILDQHLDKWNTAKNEVAKAETRLAELVHYVNPYKQIEVDLVNRLAGVHAEIVAMEAEREAAFDALEVAEAALKVFGPAGVRAHILDTVTPHLNARTSHYLSTLTDGNITAVWSTVSATAKGELREKFVIDVQSATGGESFKSLSGGEKRKVRLACAMALQDLVAARASKPIKLFIADEIDHALDPAGLERLMTLLEDKSRDKGTVLVISHTDLKDSIRNAITFTKKDGRSTLESTCLS